MSNTGQAALAIGGAIIGSFAGNPALGFQIGLLVGSQLFPTQLPHVYGPRLDDLQTTKAELGVPIPYIYGTIAVPGFVIWLGCPDEVTQTTEIGGKGGGAEQEQTTYTYFQTIAVGLCEGPIDGVRRIWENGELKYDVREQFEDEGDEEYTERMDASAEYAAGFVLYLGDELQEPDPTMETEVGIGNVPGYRGLAYIVFPNRQLRDDQARRHPQWRFEVFKNASVGRDYRRPLLLDEPSTDFELPYIAANWNANRYYVVDITSGEDYLRVFSILDNVEIEQKPFSEIFPSGNLLFNDFLVGLDGFLYFSFYIDGNTVMLSRVDPSTLQAVSHQSYTGLASSFLASWHCPIFVRRYGTRGPVDYIFSGSAATADVFLFGAGTTDVGVAATMITEHDRIQTCRGPVDGTTSYAYAMGSTAAASGVGPAIDIYRARLFETLVPSGEQIMVLDDAEIVHYASIEPAAIDPEWSRFTLVGSLMLDETDNCLIFSANGAAASGPSLGNRWVKWNPETQEIVWTTERDEVDPVAYDDSMGNNTRLRNGRLPIHHDVADFAIINTVTGEVEYQDWSAEQDSHALIGAYVYDSALNAAIAYEDGTGPVVIFFNRSEPGRVSLAEIVRDVWTRCGGDEELIDVQDLEERHVVGYATTRPMPGRGAIEPLRPLGPFDQVESEGMLKFPTRGKAIVATLSESELGAAEEIGKAPAVTSDETQGLELPMRIRVRYMAPSRDYEPGHQMSPTRFTASTVNEIDVEIPAALEDSQAAQTAEIVWAEAWASRWNYETAVDISRLELEPADAVGLPFNGRVRRTRIISVDDSGGGLLRRLQLLQDADGIYTSTAIADPPARIRTRVASFSPTALILLDLPPLRDEDDDAGIYAAAYPTNPGGVWGGAVIHRSSDDGATFAVLGSISTKATVGRLAEDLPAGITTTWDEENEILVDILAGEFESRTEAALLENAANGVAIGAPGRWEIVQFQNAVQLTATRWKLVRLLRGRRATEHNVGSGTAGDFVVLLSEGVGRLPLQIADIGVEKLYKAVTLYTSPVNGPTQPFIGNAEALEPFSPVNIEGERDGSNNLTISWTRRGRIGYEMPSGADIPLSEETETYEVDIVGQGSPIEVVRTFTVSDATEVTYTAAEQTSDGIIPGNPVTVAVYQISAVVGRGHPGEATV